MQITVHSLLCAIFTRETSAVSILVYYCSFESNLCYLADFNKYLFFVFGFKKFYFDVCKCSFLFVYHAFELIRILKLSVLKSFVSLEIPQGLTRQIIAHLILSFF